MQLQHFACNRCDFRRDVKYLPRAYRLPDGRLVPMTQRHGWCNQCNDVSPFEALSQEPAQLEMLQSQLRELKALQSLTPAEIEMLPRHKRFSAENADRYMADLLDYEHDWQDWRNLRSAPEKCLRCGNPATSMPETDWQNLIHEPCGGELACSAEIRSYNGPEWHPHVYSPNGELWEVGEKPIISSAGTTYAPMELFSKAAEPT